jgi:hypothetical protein
MKLEIWGVSRDNAEQFELRLLLDKYVDALREDTHVFLHKC